MTSMAGTSTTAAPLEQTPSGPNPASLAMPHVMRGGRPVIGMTTIAGVLGCSDGADGPFAQRAIGPQQSAIEVGGDELYRRDIGRPFGMGCGFHWGFDHLTEATVLSRRRPATSATGRPRPATATAPVLWGISAGGPAKGPQRVPTTWPRTAPPPFATAGRGFGLVIGP